MFSIIYSALCIARESDIQYILGNMILTLPLESRYGLGLPLLLRPKIDLPTYTKVSMLGLMLAHRPEANGHSSTMQVAHSTSLVSPDSKRLFASVTCVSFRAPR
jgi:hypothetical protein